MAKQRHIEAEGKMNKAGKPKRLEDMISPQERRAVAWAIKEAFEIRINSGGGNKLAEGLARAAKRAEKRNPVIASRGHEAAGNIFRMTRYDGEPANPLMHREAMKEYRRAADLVRQIYPRRAAILDRKADAEERAMEAARPDPHRYVEHRRCPDVPEECEGRRVRRNTGLPDY